MSGKGIQKFVTEERVRMSIFKHHGDLAKVVQETNVDIAYAKKIFEKVKKQRKHDVSYHIAGHISEAILATYEEQMVYYRELLHDLTDDSVKLSPCCEDDVEINFWENKAHYTCSFCNKEFPKPRFKKNLPEIRRTLESMRKLQETMTDFAAKMGYVTPTGMGGGNTLQQPGSVHVGVQINNTSDDNTKKIKAVQMDTQDLNLLEDAKQLDGPARERLIQSLESQIIEADFEKKDNDVAET